MADNNLVIEEREELIVVSPSNSFLRTGHFLTPTSINADPPSIDKFTTNYRDLPLKVNFSNLKNPTKKWESWIHRMCSLHHLTWKKAGIYDSIMSSTNVIHQSTSLIFGLVEKWCPITNSFVFPFGEATVTLEDVMVLGGYSVLGGSVLITPKDSKMVEDVEKLLVERSMISRTKAKKANQDLWMNRFMDSGSEIEHEAFLAYWLSRFVFPMNAIGRSVVSIAVHLARGVRIALAPAVLAGIYQNLSLLRAAMTAASKKVGGGCDCAPKVTVSAPLTLVQVWIWERFPTLWPNPNSVGPSEPRMARWHNFKKTHIEDLSRRIDSAAEIFEWRPYIKAMDSSFHRKIYIDNEYSVLVDTDLDEGFEGLVRCLRTSELVGLKANCIEQYLPHRVAMQFGMDQDIPDSVARVKASPEIAWSNYNRPVNDATLYVPSRLFEPGVTTQYLKLWNKIKDGWKETNADGVDEKSSFEDSKIEVKEDSLNVNSVPRQVSKRQTSSSTPNVSMTESHEKGSFTSLKRVCLGSSSSTKSNSRALVTPPGFAPKYNSVKTRDSGTGNVKRVAELFTSKSYGNREPQHDEVPSQIRSSSTVDSWNFQEVTSLLKPAESKVKNTLENEQWIDGVGSRNETLKIGGSSCFVESRLSEAPGITLEERVKNIEKLCAWLKTGKLSSILIKKLNR